VGAEAVLEVEIDVKIPEAGVIRKTVMLGEVWLPTKRSFPVVSFMIKIGAVPAA